METTINVSPEDYGAEYAGSYKIRALSWKEGQEMIRKATKSKDPLEYIQDLISASVTGPVPLTIEKQGDVPLGLMRRLTDMTLKLNDLSRHETSFL